MNPAELRTLFLFESLTDEQLGWLARHGTEQSYPAGATVFAEGDPAESFFVLLSGTLALSRKVHQDDLETVRTDQRGVYMGATQAYIRGGDVPNTYMATMRAITECSFFVLPADEFGTVIRDWFPMAIHMLEGLFFAMRNTQAVVGQRERLVALGSLSAGLMHELNNPATAAVRATATLRQEIAGSVGPGLLDQSLHWLGYALETEQLMTDIEDASARISSLVGAAKQYSQLDRASHQWIDVHAGIDSTLVMLNHKIGDGVRVVKEYDRTLPKIPAHPAELNQVWTNLVDHAVQAMQGSGTLTIRTARDGGRILVEVADTGPGVPPDLRRRVFEPFFTTKPVGQGTGLGLDISYRIVVNRHRGDLTLTSEPGDTRFQVRLPLTEPASN